MSDVLYYWNSNHGCEACDALEGVYTDPPARPHPHCQCTITEISLDNNPMGYCLLDEPVIAVHADGGISRTQVQWVGNQWYYTEFVAGFGYAIVCRDGSMISGTLEVEPELDDFPFSNSEDSGTWNDYIMDDAEDMAADIAADQCPSCIEI